MNRCAKKKLEKSYWKKAPTSKGVSIVLWSNREDNTYDYFDYDI